MKDTPPHIEAMVRERLMALSGAERMEMGARSSMAARDVVRASMPAGLSAEEQKRWLFERIYGYPWPA